MAAPQAFLACGAQTNRHTTMKKSNIIAPLLLLAAATAHGQGTIPYGYAPGSVAEEDARMLGLGDKSGSVAAAVCLDPQADGALARLKGQRVLGVRVNLQHRYRNGKNQERNFVMVASGTPDNVVAKQVVTLEEGWNDILFDSPVTIGEERLFVGAQVYETLSASHPFVAYADANVPGACWIKLKDEEWASFADRGTLCIAALLDSTATAALLERTAYAQNTTHPQTVAPGETFEGGMYVHNFSHEPISALSIATQGAGDAAPAYSDVPLTAAIPAFGSAHVTMTLRAGLTESTEAAWSAWAATIDGEQAQQGWPSQTTLAVTADNFVRTPLIEEFTSMPCPNCPYMAYYLEKGLELWREQEKGPIVYLTRRSGYRYDPFTSEADKAMEYLFNGDLYNPAVTFNRTQFEGETGIMFGSYFDSGEQFMAMFDYAAAQYAKAELAAKPRRTDDGRVELTVEGRVARDFVTRDVYISACLVEDSIPVSEKYPQEGLDGDDVPSDLHDVFRHNGVQRGAFNSAPLGDLLEVQADGTFSVSFPAIAIPAECVEKNMRVVAIIHRVNQNDIADNYVLNATEARWLATDGVATVTRQDGAQAPEAIFDLQGRRVKNPAKGLYIVGGKKRVFK